MADTYHMVNVTQSEFKKLVGQDAARVCKPVKRMIGEDGSQAHTPGMNDGFMTQTTQTSVTMDDLDLFSNDDITENGKEGKDSWKRGLSIYDEKGNMIDF